PAGQGVAGRTGLLGEQSRGGEAMRLLGEAGIRTRVGADPAPPAPAVPPAAGHYGAQRAPQPGPVGAPPAEAPPQPPARSFTPLEDEHGNPRYGQRRPAAPQDGEERTSCGSPRSRSEEHTSELQSRENLVCRLLLEKKKDQ